MLVFSVIFFIVVYFLLLNLFKLVDYIGKILMLILFVIIVIMVIKVIFLLGMFVEFIGDYKDILFFKGFFEGFLMLDVIGVFVLLIIVVNVIC